MKRVCEFLIVRSSQCVSKATPPDAGDTYTCTSDSSNWDKVYSWQAFNSTTMVQTNATSFVDGDVVVTVTYSFDPQQTGTYNSVRVMYGLEDPCLATPDPDRTCLRLYYLDVDPGCFTCPMPTSFFDNVDTRNCTCASSNCSTAACGVEGANAYVVALPFTGYWTVELLVCSTTVMGPLAKEYCMNSQMPFSLYLAVENETLVNEQNATNSVPIISNALTQSLFVNGSYSLHFSVTTLFGDASANLSYVTPSNTDTNVNISVSVTNGAPFIVMQNNTLDELYDYHVVDGMVWPMADFRGSATYVSFSFQVCASFFCFSFVPAALPPFLCLLLLPWPAAITHARFRSCFWTPATRAPTPGLSARARSAT